MNEADDSFCNKTETAVEGKAGASSEAFTKLVATNYGMYVKKCFFYLKCPHLAEDAVQEGVLTAHSKLATVKDEASLAVWLYRIIIRKAIDSLRKNKKFPSIDDNFEELVTYSKHGLLNAPVWAETSNPEEKILQAEGLKQVKEAIELLADTYRIPLLLKDFEGFSVYEISELLDISESNVKVRIHRGRTKLRNELVDYFFPVQGGSLK